MAARDILFEGLAAPVRTADCETMIERLPEYLPRWPFSSAPMGQEQPSAILANNGSAWMIQSPHTPEPRIHKTEVNAVCDLLSILASAMIAQEPDLLCFHAAALKIGDGLVLFPALRRSGKSTLSAELMARGARLFTDDYLPVRARQSGGLQGHATGIAARLRLPLPDTMSERAQAFIAAHSGPGNTQYRYLAGPEVAAHGEIAPIRSIVLLDRQDDGPAQLEVVSDGEALARLTKQNFSRGLPAGETLTALISLIRAAPPVRLTYADPGEAAELILSGALPTADGTNTEAPPFPQPGPRPDVEQLDMRFRYVRTGFARLEQAGELWVGASCDGHRILQFDSASVGVLELLEQPMTLAALVTLFAEAFPQAEMATLRDRTHDILKSFLKVGFIQRASGVV